MKGLSAFIVLFFSVTTWAQPGTLVCLESGQTAMFMTVDYQESKDPLKPNTAEISEYAPDGSVTKETIEGREPELGAMTAIDSDGNEITIITSMVPEGLGLKVRVLVCHKNQ